VKEIYRMKRDYRAQGCTLSRDVQYAFSACLSSMTQLIALSEAREEHAHARRRFAPFAAEKYAFRDTIRRKPIVPRRAWCTACV
jgi:hypothetical protein